MQLARVSASLRHGITIENSTSPSTPGVMLGLVFERSASACIKPRSPHLTGLSQRREALSVVSHRRIADQLEGTMPRYYAPRVADHHRARRNRINHDGIRSDQNIVTDVN